MFQEHWFNDWKATWSHQVLLMLKYVGAESCYLFDIYLGIMWFDLCHLTSGETQELGIIMLMAFHFTFSLLIDSNQFLRSFFTHFRRCLIKWNSMWFKTCSFWKVQPRTGGRVYSVWFKSMDLALVGRHVQIPCLPLAEKLCVCPVPRFPHLRRVIIVSLRS